MSKFLKELLTKDLSHRLTGVEDCVVANVVGLNSEATAKLRKRLREKKIRLMVVKNSLARRATAGSSLAGAFEGLAGSSAVMWGAEDFVSLVKEVTELDKDRASFEKFETRGGVMGGEKLSSAQVKEISTWPSREEQLSLLVGQILGPGANLAAQLIGPGGALANQIKQISEKE
jgi:large subunit ribosomal protein L10